ncbi:hypothetical protein INT43_008789 [Umbelopsis isabellina]|uniref:CBM21 domain-containing protein n=1 Tax=Mortierella isabellina TaxID=91625 RepID=A0A8H7UGV4_MORIS|nr:hypothetical protein INT43_008789 [Umbelopsis isabellina]
MPYTASTTTTVQPHRRVSLSKPSSFDTQRDSDFDVPPEPIPNVRLQLATDDFPLTKPVLTTATLAPKSGLRPVLKHRAHTAPVNALPKYVRFDQKLEHVRLFLKAQTPSSVQNDPVLDLEEEDVNTINLQYPNWQNKIQSSAGDMVSIESLALANDQKSMIGKCKVHNVAFNKQVTIRYTFNYWQDVEETQAAYRESIGRDSAYDRFMFNIPLNDRMTTSKHETMYFCLKYTVNAGEFWDNNDGLNYQVEIHRGSPPKPIKTADDDFAVPVKFGNKTNLSSSPTYDFPAKPLQKKPLGSRYDFGASLSAAASNKRHTSRPNVKPPPITRVQSFPSYFSPAVDEQPTPSPQRTLSISYNPGFSTLSQEGFVTNKSPISPQTVSNPIPIHARPAANSPSYYDLVNKYCFYGSDSPLSRSPNSTPAIHC